jgi:hypothetical protein
MRAPPGFPPSGPRRPGRGGPDLEERTPQPARTTLEGLLAGGALGAWLLALERSPSFHVFADLLNAAKRVLDSRLPDVLLVRLDTEPFVLALYVGGHALLGALFGAVVRARWNAYARALCVTAMLFAFDALGLGRLWQHRGLPLSTGLLLLGGGAVLALAVAWSAGLFIARLPRRVPRLLAGGGMIVCVLGIVLTTVLAARGPARPPGAFVDDPTRDDTGVRVAILGLDGLDGLIVDEAIAECAGICARSGRPSPRWSGRPWPRACFRSATASRTSSCDARGNAFRSPATSGASPRCGTSPCRPASRARS